MQSQSGEQPVGDYAAVEQFDAHAGLRNTLRELAMQRDEYAGIPMPLDNERLVIEPTYSFAAGLSKRFGADLNGDDPSGDDHGATVINRFWSDRKRSDILIWRRADGSLQWGIDPGIHHFGHDLSTLGCAEAWGIEQEHKALQLFGTLVRHRQMKQYLLTGMFLETSKRSGVTYCFRKLRPTVAIKARNGEMRILACLCMHPIAYYAGSWAGAMCPTDDVIAHLQLMRADEHMFWKRSNQHPPYRPEAGL